MSDVVGDVAEGVGTITLNRPERRNALSDEMIHGFADLLAGYTASPEVGAIVVTGAGGAFCSGGDVKGFDEAGGAGNGQQDQIEAQRRFQEATVGALYRCPKPTLASIPGAVAGAGIGLALAADLRIGGTSMVFASAFGQVGLSGDFGVAWLLEHLVGPATARELLFLNPRIRGQECADLGLVNWVVPDEELADRTRELAARLASGASYALAGMKQNLLRAPGEDLSAAMHAEVALHQAAATTADHRNAVKAFVNKEKPTFPTGWHTDGPEEDA